jgi:hypothetical protein
MFMIMWNPTGFHSIDKLPDGVTMNAKYFPENILGPLEEKYSRMEGWRMEGALSCIWTTLPFTVVDDNKFSCRSQYGATPAPAITAESRFERLLLVSSSERKTKRY